MYKHDGSLYAPVCIHTFANYKDLIWNAVQHYYYHVCFYDRVEQSSSHWRWPLIYNRMILAKTSVWFSEKTKHVYRFSQGTLEWLLIKRKPIDNSEFLFNFSPIFQLCWAIMNVFIIIIQAKTKLAGTWYLSSFINVPIVQPFILLCEQVLSKWTYWIIYRKFVKIQIKEMESEETIHKNQLPHFNKVIFYRKTDNLYSPAYMFWEFTN